MDQKEKIANRQIINYLETLTRSLGLRKAISGKELTEMQITHSVKQFVPCMRCIQDYFHIKLTLLVKFENKNDEFLGFKRQRIPFLDLKRFGLPDPEDIIDVMNFIDKREPATIYIPEHLPPWDSKEFRSLRIPMKVRSYVRTEPFATFATIMAHEMSHVVLDGKNHPLQESEIATDLCAMTQGFYEIMLLGSQTYTSRYGYLNEDQLLLAYHWIRSKVGKPTEKITSYLWLKFNF